MKIKHVAVMVLVLATAACGNPSTTQVHAAHLDTTANKQIAQSGIWLDVRTLAEYQEGHLKNAINVPVDDINQIFAITNDKQATIYLYCRSGRRAEVARQILSDLGYTNVINQGGYQDLLDKGVE